MTKQSIKAMMREAQAKGLKTFSTGEPCVNGHISERRVSKNSICLECSVEPINHGETYDSGRPCKNCGSTIKNRGKVCHPCFVEKGKASFQRHKEKAYEWQRKNRYKYKEYYEEYYKENYEMYLANNAKRRAIHTKATPSWLSKDQLQEIKEFYKNTPKGMAVDHIVPLRGKNAMGLHVPCNLQYLTRSDNSKKKNKFPACQKSMQPACFDAVDNGVKG